MCLVCSTTIVNEASADALQDDNSPADNVDMATLQVCPPLSPEADLSVTKAAAQGSVVEGDLLIYTFVVSNTGPADATNVTINDVEIGRWNGFVGNVQPAGCVEDMWDGTCKCFVDCSGAAAMPCLR